MLVFLERNVVLFFFFLGYIPRMYGMRQIFCFISTLRWSDISMVRGIIIISQNECGSKLVVDSFFRTLSVEH